ncbi:ankyrin repeat domain-containing protein [Leptospira sp. 'Mane']|uniref:ankyrin repeat domain-containing protein n=1 Tax=Leptospira sp. 'Mane' TaxID=3387407 RepID=UPI00398B0FED
MNHLSKKFQEFEILFLKYTKTFADAEGSGHFLGDDSALPYLKQYDEIKKAFSDFSNEFDKEDKVFLRQWIDLRINEIDTAVISESVRMEKHLFWENCFASFESSGKLPLIPPDIEWGLEEKRQTIDLPEFKDAFRYGKFENGEELENSIDDWINSDDGEVLLAKAISEGLSPNAYLPLENHYLLTYFSYLKKTEYVKLLLEKGALTVLPKNPQDANFPLLAACDSSVYEELSFELVSLLVLAKVSPNERNLQGENILHLILQDEESDEAFEIVNLLLNVCSDQSLHAKEFVYERTPLHIAALTGRTEIIELLLKKKPNVNLQDRYGKTPIFYCTTVVDFESFMCFANAGADLKIKDKEGRSLGDTISVTRTQYDPKDPDHIDIFKDLDRMSSFLKSH